MAVFTGHVSGRLDLILKAIVAQIINQVPNQNEETCYLTTDLDELPSTNPGEFAIAVALRTGRFDDTLIDGGGNVQTTWEGSIDVRIYSISQLDQPGRDAITLTDGAVGLINQASAVLKALCVDFVPLNDDQSPMLREPIFPADTNAERHPRAAGRMDLGFSFTFDWDLSAGDDE